MLVLLSIFLRVYNVTNFKLREGSLAALLDTRHGDCWTQLVRCCCDKSLDVAAAAAYLHISYLAATLDTPILRRPDC